MRSSSAPAEFSRMRFSRASVSRSRRNMAPRRFACAIGICAALLTGAAGQEKGNDAVDSAIGPALRAGDFRAAAAILERMVKSGDAAAQYQLGSFYRSGRGVAQDDGLAFKWMQAAAEQGHLRAQFNVGSMYIAGRGVTRDVGKGRAW